MSRGCEFFADALVDHAAARLSPARAVHVEAHLADCRECSEELAVLRRLLSAPAAIPAGLAARVRYAARAEARRARSGAAVDPAPVRRPGRGRPRWVPWALPVAAAAALALIWAGLGEPGLRSGGGDGIDLAAAAEYEPFGAWPASDGLVAGDPVLTDLSVEELQNLLEDMRP